MPAAEGSRANHVRAELESILCAPAFTRSPRLARLLTYLCSKTLAGEADQIKEYTIAVDVLDRPPSFDPDEDAIARVEVHRLRKRLREYYEKEGAADRLQIVIPNGQYVPVFAPRGVGPQTTGKAAPPATRNRRFWLLGGAALVFGLLTVAIFVLKHAASTTRALPELPPRQTEAAAVLASPAVRLACGQMQQHADRLGRQWLADQYFEGGTAVQEPRRFISRAFDPRLFDFARAGDFAYHIPLAPGTYELHLYFVETAYGPGTPGGGGEISRVFQVSANDRLVLSGFDIISDAGDPFVADVRVFKNISPAADGKLHLRFQSQREQARVSAIEIVPARPNLLNPVRIYFDDAPYTDSGGRSWMPAAYCSGGQTSRHTVPVSGTNDAELYTVERFGHFSFAIPVDTGTYALSLHFVEEYLGPGNPAAGGGVGSRQFDVFSNGVALLRNFDIYKEAGINRVLIKTFHGLKPNSQGKLRIDFVPVRDYASVYALEVIDESRL